MKLNTLTLAMLGLPLLVTPAPVHAEAGAVSDIEVLVVTSSRQAQSLVNLAEAVAVLDEDTIINVSPGHPAELLNRVSGVHVNDLGGEGHMTAIRQPISTGGVYLFLEDGLPTRPTGFFNHNGLYEIDIPNAGRVEVTKGPGSALYGSDAIGGIFNILTPDPAAQFGGRLQAELGSDGWQRGLLSVNGPLAEKHSAFWQLNSTQSDGFRQQADYQRFSTNLRLDSEVSDNTRLKTLVSFGKVDQSGTSGLSFTDFSQNPERNYYYGEMGARDVQALRLSAELRHQLSDNSELMLTPFFRDNRSEMMPSWMLSYDPVLQQTRFKSYGLLAQYSQQSSNRFNWTTGLDIDYTPANFAEQQISVSRNGDIYTDYALTGRTNYHYDANQTVLSPYAQLQWFATEQLIISLGARYDYFSVDYTDLLPEDVPQQVGRSSWLRPESQKISYRQLSPKAGIVWKFADNQQLYANRRHAFRVPSVGQVFRPGSSNDTTELEPVTALNHELGWRGQFDSSLFSKVRLDASVYDLAIKDDVVTYIDGNSRKVTNAGETSHRGIELMLQLALNAQWQWQTSGSYTRQKYENFQYLYSCFPPACVPPVSETRNFAGFEVGKAPKQLWQSSLSYQPQQLDGLWLELEWQKVGRYFTDETNTNTYPGHDLWHLRARYQLSDRVSFAARLMNITDKTYSTYTSNQVGSSAIEYRPGMPRSVFVSATVNF
ncbi:TonB-dependent receptor [Rheinheimera maricola]|uniref:TonB-dependent receptor n=1 Tax=Rheinheimera maricola TaxID=2793282 RepID=A0ABS7X9M6_9GAMM|nr:TonB-dependent receptor [Rheinheimera maricola]MBZ9611502.1 TonB-dependent receptor [Rheinheimera maricola]